MANPRPLLTENDSPEAPDTRGGMFRGLLTEQTWMRVALLPDGRVAAADGSAEVVAGATWERLGWVWDHGTPAVFVRAEIAAESWATFVNQEVFDRHDGTPVVTLRRQSESAPAALSGWILFC